MMITSFCLPRLFEVSALKILNVCMALITVRFLYCESVSFGSNVIPRVFGCVVVGSV